MWQKTLLLFSSISAFASFPNSYTPEQNLPWYALARAEARVEEMKISEMLGYLWKYHKTKKSAPAEEINYFEQQKILIGEIQKLAPSPSTQKAQLGLGGDVMWIRDHWDSFLSDEVREYLKTADGWIANLETPLSTHDSVKTFWPDYVRYNSDKQLLESFQRSPKENFFAALSTANNHSFDMEDAGARDTLALLRQKGIKQSGIRENLNDSTWSEFSLHGIRIGFYAATFGLNSAADQKRAAVHINIFPGIAPEDARPDFSEIKKALTEMAVAKIDFKVVSLHWGHEFEYYPTPKLVEAAHKIVELGADLILGNHPHVPSPDEICFMNGYEKSYAPALRSNSDCKLSDSTQQKRKAYITYAMGNFTTAMVGFPSRAIVLKQLTLYRNQEARVDWEKPKYNYFFNESGDNARRLISLNTYIKKSCGEEKNCDSSLLNELLFLKNIFSNSN